MTLPRPARFCPYCATRLGRRDDHGVRRPTCPRCGFIAYQNPSPAVAVIVPRRGRLLFVRRRYEPYAGLWSLPSGFMEYGETPEETARRETLEETGLLVDGPLVALGHVDYTRSKKRVYAFAGRAPDGASPRCASWEVDKAEFIEITRARRIIHPDQAALLDRLQRHLSPDLGLAEPEKTTA